MSWNDFILRKLLTDLMSRLSPMHERWGISGQQKRARLTSVVAIMISSIASISVGAAALPAEAHQAGKTVMRQLSNKEIEDLLKDVDVRRGGNIREDSVETFFEDGKYILRTRAEITGTYNISDGILCTKTSFQAGTYCRKLYIDPEGTIYAKISDDSASISKAYAIIVTHFSR